MPKSKLPWDVRAADVLAGRLKLDAVALIELVNEVNPTGRGRDARETASRYALKARLESLLVERFDASIAVSADPDKPGVVSLRHKIHREAACHAVVVALDDAARSWVQRALDQGQEEEASASALRSHAREESDDDPDDPDDPDEMLRVAARAEADYDFETAERLYRRAFSEQPDVSSAHALARFLVDALAADADALALESQLPPAARSHAGVRVLLGLAAARAGDESRATRLLLSVDDPRAAEGLSLLARAAITRADADAAAQRLADATRVDPAYPALRAMTEDLAKLREGQRAPLEAELGALLAAGRDVDALAKAEAILARFPDSEAARRATKQLAARQRAAESAKLLVEAEAARASGDLATSRALFQRAVAAPLDEPARLAAERSLAEVVAALRERDVEGHVARVLAALASRQEPAAGLTAYAELEAPARARVRAAHDEPALASIDEMLAAAVRPVRVIVDATTALASALACEEADPSKALAILAAHDRALEAVSAARALVVRARRRVADARQKKALADLATAEALVGSGASEAASKLLDHAARDLPEDAHERVSAVRAALAVNAARRELRARLERARATTNYHEARRAFAELAAREVDGDAWRAEAARYEDEIQASLNLRVDDLDGGVSLSRGNCLHEHPALVPTSVDLATGLLFVPNHTTRALFVRAYELATGKLVRSIEVTTPDDFYEPKVVLSGDRLLCTGGGTGMLELARASAKPERWSLLMDPERLNRRLSDAMQPVPGGRYLWLHFSDDGTEGGVHDIEGERPFRLIPSFDRFTMLPGVMPPRVAVVRDQATLSLHEPGGNQTARHDFPTWHVLGIAPHPTAESVGGRLVVTFMRGGTSLVPSELSWVDLAANGEHVVTGTLPDHQPYGGVSMAAARDIGAVFLRYRAANPQTAWLVALGSSPLRELYRVSLGERRLLVQDPEGRRVFAVGEGEGGLDITELGLEPPVFADLGPQRRFTSPLESLWSCTDPAGRASSHTYKDNFKWRPIPEVRARARVMRDAREGDLAALLELFGGVAISSDAEGAAELAAWLHERWPEDPNVEQARWTALVVQRKWREVVERLAPIDPETLGLAARKHRDHLLAAAHLALGDVARAEASYRAAEAVEGGSCNLAPLAPLFAAVRALDARPPEAAVPYDMDPVDETLALTVAADRLLARGDHEGVLALFDRRSTFDYRESQALARLVTSHLALAADSTAARVRKRFAFGSYLDTLDEVRVGFRYESLVPGATWSEERLEALAAEARAFLRGS